jgi:glucose-1-phosphate thymidylyltransferase
MHVFVLAGGFATRLWPLTERRAKPLLPVAGKPLLSYAVDAVPKELPITISTNATFQEDFMSWHTAYGRKNIDIHIEDAGHEGEKLGALGAVAKWIEENNVQEDIVLLAGDNYAGCSMQNFLSLFRGNPLVAGHDIADTELARQFGTIVTNDDASDLKQVMSFEEKPLHPVSTVVSTGWWVLPKNCLQALCVFAKTHPDNIGGVFEEFLRQNIIVDCFIFEELWKDIGSFEAYLSLHRALVGEETLMDTTASVDAKSILKGSIDLGPQTHIVSSSLSDCMLFGHATIKNCVLKRCVIDERCTLEGIDLTDQMLRAGTILQRKQ